MPRFSKEAEPTVKGDKVDLLKFLQAERGENVKQEDGTEKFVPKPDEKTGEKFENITNALAEELAKGTLKTVGGDGPDKDRVIAVETDNLVAEVRMVNLTQKIEGQKDGTKYAMEYVGFRAKTILGAMVLAGGKDDQTFETNDKGEVIKDEEGDAKELPSVTKYFNDGFKVLSNNAARARLTAILEGPDKAIERAAENLAKAKGWSIEKARAKVKAMLED